MNSQEVDIMIRVAQVSNNIGELQGRCEALEKENAFLRNLLVDKLNSGGESSSNDK